MIVPSYDRDCFGFPIFSLFDLLQPIHEHYDALGYYVVKESCSPEIYFFSKKFIDDLNAKLTNELNVNDASKRSYIIEKFVTVNKITNTSMKTLLPSSHCNS